MIPSILRTIQFIMLKVIFITNNFSENCSPKKSLFLNKSFLASASHSSRERPSELSSVAHFGILQILFPFSTLPDCRFPDSLCAFKVKHSHFLSFFPFFCSTNTTNFVNPCVIQLTTVEVARCLQQLLQAGTLLCWRKFLLTTLIPFKLSHASFHLMRTPTQYGTHTYTIVGNNHYT